MAAHISDKPEQPLPAEWVTVFDDMVLVQQRTEAERDALRAENEWLRAWKETAITNAQLAREERAENERLQETNKQLADELGTERKWREDLQALTIDQAVEIGKLRAALRDCQRFASMPDHLAADIHDALRRSVP